MKDKVISYFGIDKHGSTIKREILAGFTTFISMAYILFVNPTVLGAAHMDKGAVFTATALASAFGCLMMGLYAKYPIATAPGLGVNAFFAYSVVIGMGIPWQTALAGVFVAAIIFLLITVFKLREMIIDSIPQDLKYAISAGIGLFIAFIGMKSAGIIVANKSTLVGLAQQAGFMKDNKMPRVGKALLSDSSAMLVGSVLGTSPIGAYVESSAGIAVGGRTGLTAVTTGVLYMLGMFFSPLLTVVTSYVTAPALIMVGVLMAGNMARISWDKLEIAIPSFVILATMPLTYSIADGIALGVIFYPITMITAKRGKEVPPLMYVLFFVFLIFLWILQTGE
mgnify:CR=1 FL=1